MEGSLLSGLNKLTWPHPDPNPLNPLTPEQEGDSGSGGGGRPRDCQAPAHLPAGLVRPSTTIEFRAYLSH